MTTKNKARIVCCVHHEFKVGIPVPMSLETEPVQRGREIHETHSCGLGANRCRVRFAVKIGYFCGETGRTTLPITTLRCGRCVTADGRRPTFMFRAWSEERTALQWVSRNEYCTSTAPGDQSIRERMKLDVTA